MKHEPAVIYAKRNADFELSGDLRVFRASETPLVRMDRSWDGKPAGRLASEVSCLWSETALYFGFSCPFDDVFMDTEAPVDRARWQLWDLDIAEVLISAQRQPVDHYYEFEIAPSGHWLDLEVIFRGGRPYYNWDRRLNAGVRSYVNWQGKVWTAELKVPAAVLSGRKLQAGDEVSLNLFRAQGPPESRHYLAVWPTFAPLPDFHIPSRFRTLRLVE